MHQAYRFTDDKSDKFWAIQTGGNSLMVNYGKTGSLGRFQVKEYADGDECAKQAQKLIAAKVKKGYALWEDFDFDSRLYFDDDETGLHPLTSHPRFRAHFTDDFYYDCMNDEAPFGSDDANDTLYHLCEYIKKMRDANLMDFPQRLQVQDWELEWFEPTEPTEEAVRAILARGNIDGLPIATHLLSCDHVIVATAFGQIKVMGRVFDRLREMALHSLRRMALLFQLEGYGDSPTTAKMIADLESFQNPVHAPSETAQALVDYLSCPCRVFPPSLDDDDIIYAYDRAQALEGRTPLLVVVSDILLEAVTLAVDDDSDMDFNPEAVRRWRGETLAKIVSVDAEEVLKSKEALPQELIGRINLKRAERRGRFSALWNSGHPAGDSGTLAKLHHTYEVILAELPTANPWEAAVYVPMGGFNECPGPAEQAAVMRRWQEQHGAVPGLCSYDEWEFRAPPVAEEDAAALTPEQRDKLMRLATEQYRFCTDRIDQYSSDYTLGDLASSLAVSSHWYFWWD